MLSVLDSHHGAIQINITIKRITHANKRSDHLHYHLLGGRWLIRQMVNENEEEEPIVF